MKVSIITMIILPELSKFLFIIIVCARRIQIDLFEYSLKYIAFDILCIYFLLLLANTWDTDLLLTI